MDLFEVASQVNELLEASSAIRKLTSQPLLMVRCIACMEMIASENLKWSYQFETK